MKKLILTLALILCGYAISNASILTKQSVELTVGSNPVSILENPSDGMIHIFCAGIDANDNNAFDEGEDERPSWWTYNPTGSSSEANKVKEFDNYFVSPFKPSIGTGLINITFKSDEMNNEFVGDTRFEVYSIANLSLLYDDVVSQSEVLTTKYYTDYAITLSRTNGADILSRTNLTTNETTNIILTGNASDFTFLDLDDDGTDEVAILVDNKTMAYYKVGTDIELIKEIDLNIINGFTEVIGSITTDGKNIFLPNPGVIYSINLNSQTNDLEYKENIIERGIVGNNIYIGVLPNNFTLAATNWHEFNVLDFSKEEVSDKFIEIHKTNSQVGLINYLNGAVYVADATTDKSTNKTSNKILIFDYTNETIKDPTYSDKTFTTFQPLDLMLFDNNIISLNLGFDVNFDGEIILNEGDIYPSIWKNPFEDGNISDRYNEEFVIKFPINFPLNTNISSDGDITIPSGNSVHYYNVEDNEVYESFDAGMYVSTAFRVLDYLVLGQRDYANGKSYVRIKKGDFIDVSTEVGANVVDCIVYQNNSGFGVVSLSEGNFGQPDAKINIIKLSTMGIGDNTAIDVGTGGNSIVANADQLKAAVVMNGSHEIHILNLITGEIDLTFSTGTSGYGGPRDAKFQDDKLYVSTYSNKILVFDSNNGNQLSSITIDGNSEGIAITSNYLLAANINYSNYQPSNRIFAYDLDKITSVEETKQTQQTIRVYPHPVANDFHLVSDDLAGTNDIAIINSQGKIVATHSGSSNGAIALNADALGLVAGNYTAVINGTRAVRFVVIK